MMSRVDGNDAMVSGHLFPDLMRFFFNFYFVLVQPRSQGFSHWIWEGREKTLASAGHVIPNTRKFWV